MVAQIKLLVITSIILFCEILYFPSLFSISIEFLNFSLSLYFLSLFLYYLAKGCLLFLGLIWIIFVRFLTLVRYLVIILLNFFKRFSQLLIGLLYFVAIRIPFNRMWQQFLRLCRRIKDNLIRLILTLYNMVFVFLLQILLFINWMITTSLRRLKLVIVIWIQALYLFILLCVLFTSTIVFLLFIILVPIISPVTIILYSISVFLEFLLFSFFSVILWLTY